VERKADPNPIIVPRLAVAVYGGTQPDKLARLLREGDDGLLGRLLWLWPAPVPFRLEHQTLRVEWAIRALDRLGELDLQPGDSPMPIRVPLTAEGRGMIESFARDMQDRQKNANGLLCAAFGKARGQALRLALALEMLWWCGEDGVLPPPTRISPRAFATAADLMGIILWRWRNGSMATSL
jgi:putative DNA primase/helicase